MLGRRRRDRGVDPYLGLGRFDFGASCVTLTVAVIPCPVVLLCVECVLCCVETC